jgi:hypothetical protein
LCFIYRDWPDLYVVYRMKKAAEWQPFYKEKITQASANRTTDPG